MATVIPPRSNWDRTETHRRIRHPLQSLSGKIRWYVTMEGLAVAILFIAACFWITLALDFGLFKLLAADWVKWLDRTFPADTAFFVRAFLLGLAGIALLALVAFKVLRRLFTEFSDTALALVLERRYPKQLGDRLITAVELADSRMAEEYGYSQEMVDHTIRSAAERVESVPVSEVFDWRRLNKLWALALACSLGVYLLVFGGFATYLAVNEQPPLQHFAKFNRTTSIWAKRNVLLMHHIYWPTQAYVEFVRFQVSETQEDGTEVMKVARDEKRPDIEARAFQWVIFDPKTRDSIRPMTVPDLEGWVSVTAEEIPLAATWGEWIMDVDDLDPGVTSTLIPDDWQGKKSKEIRAQLKKPAVRQAFAKAGVLDEVEAWLDWRTWTLDRLQLQALENKQVRQALRRKNPDAVEQIENLFAELEVVSQSHWTNWNVRKLKLPGRIYVTYVGEETRSHRPFDRQEENRFYVSLAELKESVSMTIRAEDFYTIPKSIVLVPPPRFNSLEIQLDEPAYKYFYLQGSQDALRGARFRSTKNMSLTGPVSQQEVLFGSSVKIIATSERPLKEGILITEPDNRRIKNALVPDSTVVLAENKKTFSVEIHDIQDHYEFEFRFTDLDKVKGKRHILIKVAPDEPPFESARLNLAAKLRPPPASADGVSNSAANLGSYLITPKALLPFDGAMKDDIGLTKMTWVYDYHEVQFSLFRDLTLDPAKDPELILKNKYLRDRAKILLFGLHAFPGHPVYQLASPAHAQAAGYYIDRHLAAVKELKEKAKQKGFVKGAQEMEVFQAKMAALDRDRAMLPGDFVRDWKNKQSSAKPPRQILLKEYALTSEVGFDVDAYIPKLQPESQDDIQKHYQLRIWMQATDNNLETGPNSTLSQEPVTFLVVSEAELHALILLQEDKIRTKLEEIRDELKKEGNVVLADQKAKLLPDVPLDLTLVRIRIDQVRKVLEKTGNVTRKALTEYEQIYDELYINRMSESLRDRVSVKIIDPLRLITNPKFGEIIDTQAAANTVYDALQANEKVFKAVQGNPVPIPKDIRDEHIKQIEEVEGKLNQLIFKLNNVIEAIGGEFDRARAEALLKAILEDQRRQHEALATLRKKMEDELLKIIGDLQ